MFGIEEVTQSMQGIRRTPGETQVLQVDVEANTDELLKELNLDDYVIMQFKGERCSQVIYRQFLTDD